MTSTGGMTQDFAPIGAALRTAVTEHFAARGEATDTDAGRSTIETNSTLAARRAEALVEPFLSRSGTASLAGLRVADLGCGFGALALAFAAHGATVSAIDANRRRMRVGVAMAERFGLPVVFRQASFLDHELPLEAFDLVVMNNALCYLVPRAERRTALERARAVLRPGGWIVVRDPNRLHPRDPFTGTPLVHMAPPGVANAVLRRFGVARSVARVTTPGGAARALRRAGFADVAYDGSGQPARPFDRFAGFHHVSGRRA